ncbi:MAG: glycine betaine ABC transporter substrate-binding protein [Candidatus Anammoxibacter sp.]
MKIILITLTTLFFSSVCLAQTEPVKISSKNFIESYILAEIFAGKIEENSPDQDVKRKLGMGGTGILFEALKNGDIDFYPEYTGTIAEAILKRPGLKTNHEINRALLPMGLTISKALGFNNTYAFAVKKETAKKYNLKMISDLVDYPDMRFGFSYEFMNRSDGYYALAEKYGLKQQNVKGMEHSLAYEAIVTNAVDLIDVYSTDAMIRKLDLVILEDNIEFFPRYDAVILANVGFVRRYPKIWSQLTSLENSIDEDEMMRLNVLVNLEKFTFKEAAASFLHTGSYARDNQRIKYNQIWKKTREHLFLVFISLLFSIVVGVPLGYFATWSKWLKQTIFAISGVVQTIPSLALLCFFVPILGIGITPALTALFLYGLLPIVRNTNTGIESIDKKLRETSQILGLKRWQNFIWVELPLAMPSILSGIKTSAIINVGTATLAAFIGCGGLGSFIVTGLALNDINIILHGAIPSACLALILQWLFDGVDRFCISKGLRQ